MLYNLARKGEIDPLNIDVVEVADKFLEELERAKKLDLRISGKVLLYAAILVRMKSDIVTSEAIGLEDYEEFQDYGEFFDDVHAYDPEFDDYISQDFIEDDLSMEDELIRVFITAGKKKIRRYTTLKDLIMELESAERVRKRRRERRRLERAISEDPLKIPHDENLEEMIERVRVKVLKLMKNRDVIRLGEIAGIDLISRYISVLHLAFRKIFEIHQERIFESDIEIRLVRDEEGN